MSLSARLSGIRDGRERDAQVSRASPRVAAAGLHVVAATAAGNRLRPMRPVAPLTCTAAAEGRGEEGCQRRGRVTQLAFGRLI